MNNEIKEILDIEKYRNKDGYVENINLLPSEIHKLLDYITNLQEEIERLNNIIKEVREYIENNWINQKDADMYRFDTEELGIEISDIAVLYDLLDKGGVQ